jgi:hypothetical protein
MFVQAFHPVERYLISEKPRPFPQKSALASHLHPWPVHLFSIPPLLLKPPKEEQDENNYQDRPQNTAGAIPPVLAMWPGRKGADEKEDEHDN